MRPLQSACNGAHAQVRTSHDPEVFRRRDDSVSFLRNFCRDATSMPLHDPLLSWTPRNDCDAAIASPLRARSDILVPRARMRAGAMRRRQFLSLLGSAAIAARSPSLAQSANQTYRVGLFNPGGGCHRREPIWCSFDPPPREARLRARAQPRIRAARRRRPLRSPSRPGRTSLLPVRSTSSWHSGTERHLQLRHERRCRL